MQVSCKALAATSRHIAQTLRQGFTAGDTYATLSPASALARAPLRGTAHPSFARPGTRRARSRLRRAAAAARHGHRLRAPVLHADHRREQRARRRARRSSCSGLIYGRLPNRLGIEQDRLRHRRRVAGIGSFDLRRRDRGQLREHQRNDAGLRSATTGRNSISSLDREGFRVPDAYPLDGLRQWRLDDRRERIG